MSFCVWDVFSVWCIDKQSHIGTVCSCIHYYLHRSLLNSLYHNYYYFLQTCRCSRNLNHLDHQPMVTHYYINVIDSFWVNMLYTALLGLFERTWVTVELSHVVCCVTVELSHVVCWVTVELSHVVCCVDVQFSRKWNIELWKTWTLGRQMHSG